ncbi:hypothetical protein IFVP203_C1120271 [Vibrio parahaemolyticus]
MNVSNKACIFARLYTLYRNLSLRALLGFMPAKHSYCELRYKS